MKKILFISNIVKGITNFSFPSIEASHQLGYEFHMAANLAEFTDNASKYGVTLHHIDLIRNPFSLKNIRAYKQMTTLIRHEKFDVIHCNTPIGGVLGRLCGKRANVRRIIYTAHGFHFYKGAPLINKTLYKWVEMWLAHYTDSIITINNEDYQAAQKFKLRNNGKVYYIPGVGVDTALYKPTGVDRQAIRDPLGLTGDDIVLIAMGDLIHRKNYVSSIRAIAKADNPKLHFLICGEGSQLDELKALAEDLNIENQIHFLGFRSDIRELLQIADIFLFTTYQEGLPRSMMEAMAAGLPCIASGIRGNTDLIENGRGGYLCGPEDVGAFAESINILASDESKRRFMGLHNLETIAQFDVSNVKNEIRELYDKELEQVAMEGVPK